jgi:D-beta-D-heptose 7-phosphate kinase/D-beta-D-heptose 1-phosphate adenosyltransferase
MDQQRMTDNSRVQHGVADQHRLPADTELAGIVRGFRDARVLVVGDLILDRYVVGSVHRMSQEAPIPVLRPIRQQATLGGAANVALNIATLGGQAWLAGVVGDDAAGAEIAQLLAASDRIHPCLTVSPGRQTTAKTRFMAGSHQLLRLDEETTVPIDAAATAALLARVEALLDTIDVVVLSDYAKGVLSDVVLGRILALGAARGRIVIADPKRADFSAYRGATLLTPNEAEIRLATRIEVHDDASAERAGHAALAACEADAVLVTRSEKGMTLVRRDAATVHLPTRARAVADVSGAGDTVAAALAVALAAGAALPPAAALANVTAGISVGKPGTATVSGEELLGVLHLEELVASDRKVANSWDEAAARTAAWRASGLRVGFANGCFDLIHPGHVHLLTEARAACDRLVVALNTDASVRKLKGPTRPVQSETARATVMASLAPVDLVVLFDQDTPLELVKALRPDVLVKGSDYRVEDVVGGAEVQGWGGKVVLVDLQQGHSTTGTIKRMRTPEAAA